MNLSNLTIGIMLCLPFAVYSQSDSITFTKAIRYQYHIDQDLAIVTGYQLHKNQFAEIGLGLMDDGVVGHHPYTLIYALSNELRLSKDFIWGLKAGVWIGSGYNLGLNVINYTNFKENALRFRPEIGMGFGIFRVVYGYNFSITNKDFAGVNKHNFGLNVMIKVKRLKEVRK